jgi:hypothetical protein
MKRQNPETNMPFSRGDIRTDGWLFHAYKRNLKANGFFGELWHAPSTVKTSNEQARKTASDKRLGAERGGHLVRRQNPATLKPFVIGDRDDKGRYFVSYHNYSYDKVFFNEQWASEARWHRLHIANTVATARKRAIKKNVAFDIDANYAQSIYPKDGICPALGILMSWGSKYDRSTSPSLDRLLPDIGYIKGNVFWISSRANVIKNDASIDELQLVVAWLIKGTESNSS